MRILLIMMLINGFLLVEANAQRKDASRYQKLMEQGIGLFQKKNYGQALPIFEQCGELNKSDTIAPLYAAVTAQQLQDVPRTKVLLEKYIVRGGNDPKIYGSLSVLYKNDKETEKALATIDKGLAIAPTNKDLLNERINILIASDQLDAAIASLKSRSEQDPNDVLSLVNLGILYDNASAQLAKQQTLTQEQRHNEQALHGLAKTYYNRALIVDPQNFDALYNLGVLYFNEAAFLKIKVDNLDTKAYAKYGRMLDEFVFGKFRMAHPYFTKAKSIRQEADVLTNLTNLDNIIAQYTQKNIKAVEREEPIEALYELAARPTPAPTSPDVAKKSTPRPVSQSPPPVYTRLIWLNPRSQASAIRWNQDVIPVELLVIGPTSLTRQQVRFRRNGVWLDGSKFGETQLSGSGTEFTIKVTIPLKEGENKLEAVVTPAGTQEVVSAPLRINFLPNGKPNLFVFAVGINRDLHYPAIDAQSVHDLFKSQRGKLFNDVQTELFNTPETTTAGNLRTELGLLQDRGLTESDVLILFISAHGKKTFINNRADFAILCSDYNGRNALTEENTVLHFTDRLIRYLEPIRCKKVIFFDACHSGEAVRLTGSKSQYLTELADAQAQLSHTPPGIVVFSSSSDGELSYEDDQWRHGAFTKALLDGINGAANTDQNQFVSIGELAKYVEITVPALVKQVAKGPQNPKLRNRIERDFSLFQLR